jgi:putative membrane protein insertion efficiency factor
MNPLNWLAILAIRIYQGSLAKLLRKRGVRCLHYPSCSEYGVMAFRKYGFLKATVQTWGRYRDCNPFSGRPYIDFP